ncbi:hypothetical protein FF38_11778 [Lucilia cuprina]|uniref:Uncharacterized protein n=1 Tax=Lucilia cuprina TaxID=7375 RepID=A0A0L0BMB9_LUCCU|nr:hypothetical protein FF38_11778 [Lucilia cuprina]
MKFNVDGIFGKERLRDYGNVFNALIDIISTNNDLPEKPLRADFQRQKKNLSHRVYRAETLLSRTQVCCQKPKSIECSSRKTYDSITIPSVLRYPCRNGIKLISLLSSSLLVQKLSSRTSHKLRQTSAVYSKHYTSMFSSSSFYSPLSPSATKINKVKQKYTVEFGIINF